MYDAQSLGQGARLPSDHAPIEAGQILGRGEFRGYPLGRPGDATEVNGKRRYMEYPYNKINHACGASANVITLPLTV